MCKSHICYIIPAYMLKNMATSSPDQRVREMAVNSLALSGGLQATRTMLADLAPSMLAAPVAPQLNRKICNMNHIGMSFLLPGRTVRAEHDSPTSDVAVNEAFDNSGKTYDFYFDLFQRNSIDDNGMTILSSVHFASNYDNAFWNGRQMVYGDGDNIIFQCFTKGLDVVGHELTHGVTSYTSNLDYQDESGALNEHFSDVMGLLIKQRDCALSAAQSDWLIGKEIMVPSPTVKALRSFKDEKAYENDPHLGTDPQPKYYKDKYTGSQDQGGVHINSGIPNHAFYRVAAAIGGYAWEEAAKIWFETFTKHLSFNSNFQDAANMTCQVAGQMFGAASAERTAVIDGWTYVGVSPQVLNCNTGG